MTKDRKQQSGWAKSSNPARVPWSKRKWYKRLQWYGVLPTKTTRNKRWRTEYRWGGTALLLMGALYFYWGFGGDDDDDLWVLVSLYTVIIISVVLYRFRKWLLKRKKDQKD